jgi:hypothetical protein
MSLETKRKIAGYALLLSMLALAIGITANNVFFTWASIVLVLISLALGGRWKRLKRP